MSEQTGSDDYKITLFIPHVHDKEFNQMLSSHPGNLKHPLKLL